MKVCLYFEGSRFLGQIIYRTAGSGLLSSYVNQKDVLRSLKIPFAQSWDCSCDILQVNVPGIRSLRLIDRARRSGKKVALWAHITAEDTVGVFRFAGPISSITRRYLKHAYSLGDLVFCPSEHTRSLLAAYGVDKSKLVVLSNGVNRTRFCRDAALRQEYRQTFGLSGVVVGTLGLAIPRKGIDTFIALARRFPAHQFIWYGRIYNAMVAEALPKELPANVQFSGYVDDAAAAMNSLDIFLFPSYEENQGMAIIEAGSVGLPLLVRDLPAYSGWLNHNQNCLKAETDDQFEAHLATLLENKTERTRLAASAQTMAESEGIEAVARQIMGHYKDLMGDPVPA
jgi:1,2-diacylglycerol-3-alpha-glucose alpha-1,2-glucosyltransferase